MASLRMAVRAQSTLCFLARKRGRRHWRAALRNLQRHFTSVPSLASNPALLHSQSNSDVTVSSSIGQAPRPSLQCLLHAHGTGRAPPGLLSIGQTAHCCQQLPIQRCPAALLYKANASAHSCNAPKSTHQAARSWFFFTSAPMHAHSNAYPSSRLHCTTSTTTIISPTPPGC